MRDLLGLAKQAVEGIKPLACSPRKHDQFAPPRLMASKQQSIDEIFSLVYMD
jgi:hypothetical protein